MQRTPEWDKAFDTMLAYIASEKTGNTDNGIILDSNSTDFSKLEADADLEALSLFESAIKTLKSDALSHECGDLTLACTRLSLRNSGLAKSLHVDAPVFEQNENFAVGLEADEATAYDMMKILMGVAIHDMKESRQHLIDALNTARDRDLKAAAENPALNENNDYMDSVHRQMALMLKQTISSYKRTYYALCDHITENAPNRDADPVLKLNPTRFPGRRPF